METTTLLQRIKANVAQVIVGKESVTELLLVALLAEGHVLMEDVPGLGKTTLAKALARSLDCSFARIQFTPDLLPGDVTGINFYNQKTQSFEFRAGPVHNHILLADEINRATPRVQSALLEAMQERQVTVDGVTLPLPAPFMVLATQNPIELEGTFPLPEAQMDRFLMQIALGYPTLQEEDEILQRYQTNDPLVTLRPVITRDEVLALQHVTRTVHVSPDVRQYILNLVHATREHEAVSLGVSPRGSLALFRAAQALALLRGRDFVIPSDVQSLAPAVLTHRVHISPYIRLRGRTPEQVVSDILNAVPVPVVA